MNFLAQRRKKILLQENFPSSGKEQPFDNFFYKEIAQLTDAGGFLVDFIKKETQFDDNIKKLLDLPSHFRPSLNKLLRFCDPSDHDKVIAYLNQCSNGTPISTIMKMKKFHGEEFWAKIIAKPIYDDDEDIIGVQGVLLDITKEHKRDLELKRSFKTIASQNYRLYECAHIVSEHLRSHANNIKLSVELLNDVEDRKEETELMSGLDTISEELCDTIQHLSQMISIKDNAKQQKQSVSLKHILDETTKKLQKQISESRTEIFTDFSEAPHVDYIPAYLEYYLVNLITNAIQFKHDDRNPVIDIYTLEENGIICLVVKDNGRGFDLDKHKDKVFTIYQTFHPEISNNGISLFMIKNKVESLRGSITVDSSIDQGTTFKISF